MIIYRANPAPLDDLVAGSLRALYPGLPRFDPAESMIDTISRAINRTRRMGAAGRVKWVALRCAPLENPPDWFTRLQVRVTNESSQ
jgi:hypothetical protein